MAVLLASWFLGFLFEAMDLADASTHDDCTCMKRKYCVSLKDDFSSTRGKCIRYDFKLRHKASRLKLIIHVLHESRKRSFNMVATWCALLSLGKLASVVNCLRELLPPKPGLSPEFWAMKV